MSKLKPCPFCGSKAHYWLKREACCSDQSCLGALNTGVPEKWNSRPIEDELRHRAEKAEVENVDREDAHIRLYSEYKELQSARNVLAAEVDKLRESLRWRKYPKEKPQEGQYVLVKYRGRYLAARYAGNEYNDHKRFYVVTHETIHGNLGNNNVYEWLPIPKIKEGE